MTTIFIPPSEIAKRSKIGLSTEKSHYLINVMRCRGGDNISVIDGSGKAFLAEIQSINNSLVFVNILNELTIDTESPFNIILCQGMIKGEKMDFVIHKAAELGVKQIIPLITERVVIKETRKVKRWQKIAEEAAEQCRRAVIPLVQEPITITSLLSSDAFTRDIQSLNGFIFWEECGEPFLQAFKKIVFYRKTNNINNDIPLYIVIGPEGGLTLDEVRAAEKSRFIRTTLGKRLLKSETASIVSIALIQFMLESLTADSFDF